MKIRTLLAAGAMLGGLALPAGATAPPPDPSTCTPKIQAALTPAVQPGLVGVGRVGVATAEIVCTRDVLNTTPADDLAKWWGHITIYWQPSTGYVANPCGAGPYVIDAVGPVLVLRAVQQCVIPYNDPHVNDPWEIVVTWATLDSTNYLCCQTRVVKAAPAGVL